MRKLLSLVLVLILLGGCNLRGGEQSEAKPAEEEGLRLLSWNDSGPISYTDDSDWTKFSFSDFGLKLPRNFRVINLAEDQQYVELVNYAEVEDKSVGNNGMGQLKLKVAIDKSATSVEEAVGERKVLETLVVAGRTATKVESGGAFDVLVKSQTQNKVYVFSFSRDFEEFEELANLILSTVSFHQREVVR